MKTNETLSIIRKESCDRVEKELISEFTETELPTSVHTESSSQQFYNDSELNLQKMFTSDRASVMLGRKNKVAAMLK
jgi:hypothetical protein